MDLISKVRHIQRPAWILLVALLVYWCQTEVDLASQIQILLYVFQNLLLLGDLQLERIHLLVVLISHHVHSLLQSAAIAASVLLRLKLSFDLVRAQIHSVILYSFGFVGWFLALVLRGAAQCLRLLIFTAFGLVVGSWLCWSWSWVSNCLVACFGLYFFRDACVLWLNIS